MTKRQFNIIWKWKKKIYNLISRSVFPWNLDGYVLITYTIQYLYEKYIQPYLNEDHIFFSKSILIINEPTRKKLKYAVQSFNESANFFT